MNIITEQSGNGELLYNTEFKNLLDFNSIHSFDDLWNLEGESVKNKLAERGTARIMLESPDGGQVETYIKRYLPLPKKEYFKAITSFRPFFPSGAVHEWESIIAFHRENIPTMKPIAVARETSGKSVLLTLGIQNYRRASDLLKEWFNNKEHCEVRRKLIANIAELAGKMHAAKLAHQDFYLVHMFVMDDLSVMPIDLQRIIMENQFGRRWRVKDLGQMLYAAMDISSKSDRMRFWKKYTDIAGPEMYRNKALIKSVYAKANRIYERSVRKKKRKEKENR